MCLTAEKTKRTEKQEATDLDEASYRFVGTALSPLHSNLHKNNRRVNETYENTTIERVSTRRKF